MCSQRTRSADMGRDGALAMPPLGASNAEMMSSASAGFSVNGAEFHRLDGGSDISVAGQNDRAYVGSLLLEERNDVQAAAVMETHFYYGIFWRTQLNLVESIGNRVGSYHPKPWASIARAKDCINGSSSSTIISDCKGGRAVGPER